MVNQFPLFPADRPGLGEGALLWTASQRRELPLEQVTDIQPTMNFAYVRIQGRVVSDARVFQEGGRLLRGRERDADPVDTALEWGDPKSG